MSNVDRILEGAVDIHVHFAPDPKVERRADALAVARQAREMGMRGLVLKSHEYPTQPVAYTVNQVIPDITLIGGVALDVQVLFRPGGPPAQGIERGYCLLDERGKLLPEVHDILAVVKSHDMVLATGHVSTRECMVLVEEARNQGIRRVVVTHGTTSAFWTGMTAADMKAMAEMGAYVEHCLHVMMPTTYRLSPQELVETIRTIGPENCIVSSDFGQDFHPMPAEGMRMGIAILLQAGLDEVEVGMLVKDNPSRLLGL